MNLKINVLIFSQLLSFLLISTCESAFNTNEWGARPMGMGECYVSVADDINAVAWNPAGLAQMTCPAMSFMYAKPFMGLSNVNINYMYSAYAYPFNILDYKMTFGTCWTNVSVENYKENTYILSYSCKLGAEKNKENIKNDLYLGGNLKILDLEITPDNDSINDPVFSKSTSQKSLTGDVGLLYSIRYINTTIGLALKNFTEPDMGLVERNKIPKETHIGITYKHNILKNFSMLYSGSMTLINGEKFSNEGVEISYASLGIRGGINSNKYTLGASYNAGLVQIDYAYVIPIELKNSNINSHYISLTLKFNDTLSTDESFEDLQNNHNVILESPIFLSN